MYTVTPSQRTLIEQAVSFLAAKAWRHRTVLVSSFFFGLLAHGFAFTNKLVNHDDVASLFLKGATVESGRWGLGLLDSIFPNYSMPWIYGLISIALLAIAVCFLVDLFSIRSKLLQCMMAGCIVTFPSLTGTFSYMFTASSYALSFLLTAIAIWLLPQKGLLRKLLALGMQIASLSIYQSYISIAAALLVLVLFQRILEGEPTAQIIKTGLCYVSFLLLSLGLYYAATQIVLRLTGVQMCYYAQSSITFQLSELPSRVIFAYAQFWEFLTEGYHGLIPTALSRVLHWWLLALSIGLGLPWLFTRKREDIPSTLLALLLLALLPLAINCMYLIISEYSIHTLVLYSFVAIYFIPLILAETLVSPLPGRILTVLHRAALNLVPVLLCGIVLINTYIANEAYLDMHLRYENTFAFYTSLTSQIQQNPEFTEDTRLAVIGPYTPPEFYSENFSNSENITGTYGLSPDCYSWGQYLTYYIGFPIPRASLEEVSRIQDTPEFQAMPCYPYYGCMAVFDDVFVVKLS